MHYSEFLSEVGRNERTFALECATADRPRVLQSFLDWAEQLGMPLYYWNAGYLGLQTVARSGASLSFTACSGEGFSLEKLRLERKAGVYWLEDLFELDRQTGNFSARRAAEIRNLWMDANSNLYLVFVSEVIYIPQSFEATMVPLQVPLPESNQIEHAFKSVEWDVTPELLIAAAGLTLGEIGILIRRSSNFDTDNRVRTFHEYKVAKLTRRGMQLLGQPEAVSLVGYEVLLEEIQRFKYLLEPEAQFVQLDFPKGLLLMGPPGTGKSQIAKYAASVLGVQLIAADWGSFLTADFPDAALQEFIDIVERMAPIEVYFDDFDKGFSGWSEGGAASRLAQKFLTWMQERTSRVLVVATVNRLELLPAEITRRFEERFFFLGLPHDGARYEIFQHHLGKYFIREGWDASKWNVILREYRFATPAEIGNAIRQVAERKYAEAREQGKFPQKLAVTPEDLLHQRQQFVPLAQRQEDEFLLMSHRAKLAARPAAKPDRSQFARSEGTIFGC